MIVIGESGSPFVVWTKDQLLHNALDAGIHISSQIGSGQIEGNKMCRYGHHVAEVTCQTESKHSKLMTFQGVLKQIKTVKNIQQSNI